jgi:protein Mpv17
VSLLSGSTPSESGAQVAAKIKPIVTTAWKFWPAVHCLTYSVVPARHRVLWVNCVDLFWNAILATKSRGEGAREEGARGEGAREEGAAEEERRES